MDNESPKSDHPGSPQPSGDYVLIAEPGYYRMGPLGTWMHGRAFKVAADASVDAPGSLSSVAGFLYCRAIEQALKAYLLARGGGLTRVREVGHDLHKLLIETDARGIDYLIRLTADEKRLIMEVGDLYQENKLAYFNLFYAVSGPKVPLPQLASVTTRLLEALHDACLTAGHEETWSPLPVDRGAPGRGQ